jgi:hypothetical protein
MADFKPSANARSNFITPPDFVETVLILNATEAQVSLCANACYDSEKVYNVYFYHESMNNEAWLARVHKIADTVIDASSTDPTEYFNK